MMAFGYARVSTDGQATDGISLEAQSRRIEMWCQANGCELKRVFVDAGLSGKRADNRPALRDALGAVCREQGALIVYSLSRLARSTKDTIAIGERLERAGADLVSLTERIDTTSAAGKMVFRMLAVLAEFERDLVSERTRTALACKRTRQERVGQVPFGYDLASDGIALVPNVGEQHVIATMEQWRAEGHSLRTIAAGLTKLGIPTKEGRDRWSHQAVASVLERVPANVTISKPTAIGPMGSWETVGTTSRLLFEL